MDCSVIFSNKAAATKVVTVLPYAIAIHSKYEQNSMSPWRASPAYTQCKILCKR